MIAMRLLPRLGLAAAAAALTGASLPERETRPGEGVLCIGTMLYFADLKARTCHAGKDPQYQERLSRYVARIDQYLIRNFPGGEAQLEQFKESQGVTREARPDICEADTDNKVYEAYLKITQEKLDAGIEEMLSRDGPPSFGDCV